MLLLYPSGTMRAGLGVMMSVCIMQAARPYPIHLDVSVDALYCVLKGPDLSCNYTNGDQVVNMVEQVNETVQKVFVYNAVKLQLSEAVCVSVMVNNVADVVVVKGEEHPCDRHLTFSATNSTLNRLPSQVDHVHLQDSNITSLAVKVNITQLTVINSIIKVLDISSLFTFGASINFVSTHIDTLQRLHVTNGSELLLQRTKVDVLSPQAVVIDGGNLVMRNSSAITVAEESVVMYPGSKLNLEQFSGNLRVKAMGRVGATSQTTPCSTRRPCNCETATSYLGAFVACLLLLIVSVIINILGVVYVKRNYLQRDNHKTEERQQGQLGPQSCVKYSKGEETQLLPQQSSSDSLQTYKDSLLQLLKDFEDKRQRVKSKHESFILELNNANEAEMNDKKDKADENLDENIKLKEKKILDLEEELIAIDASGKYAANKKALVEAKKELIDALKENVKVSKLILPESQKLVKRKKVWSENDQWLKNMAEISQDWLTRWSETRTSHDEITTRLSPLEKLFIITGDLLSREVKRVLRKYESEPVQTEVNIKNISEEDEMLKESVKCKYLTEKEIFEKGRDKYMNDLKNKYEIETDIVIKQYLTHLERLEVHYKTKLLKLDEARLAAGDKLSHQEALGRIQEKHLTDMETIMNNILAVQNSHTFLLDHLRVNQIFNTQLDT
ncbi:uncharacterized protein LOC121869041 [Homarus americanus]|uniref:uncharacterized protein LOC121869041 n=1 Tax=Homarus americanus TaxID=6706 RepID=UPI001C43D2C9|nr:uncharacterized protein LOC121869041 [Homarus americanus]